MDSLARKKIEKAMNSLQRALDNYDNDNRRLAVGDLDFAEEFITAATHLTIVEIKESEGKF